MEAQNLGEEWEIMKNKPGSSSKKSGMLVKNVSDISGKYPDNALNFSMFND